MECAPRLCASAGLRRTQFPGRPCGEAAGGTRGAALAAEVTCRVGVGKLRGDGLFRDRSLGPLREPGEGGSGHQDQPPDPASGGGQGEGGPLAATAREIRVRSLLSWRLRSVWAAWSAAAERLETKAWDCEEDGPWLFSSGEWGQVGQE